MMKIKKIAMSAFLIFSTILVSAENKQQVRLMNNYGQKITVDFLWKNKFFPYDLKVERKDFESNVNNSLTKAPVSGYRLFQVLTTPSKNLNLNKNDAVHLAGLGVGVGGAVTGNIAVAYAGLSLQTVALLAKMLESKNHFILKKVHDNLFFSIEKGDKSSAIKGQKKIVIKAYKSESHYQDAITDNVQPALDEDTLDEMTGGEMLDEVKELLDDLSEGQPAAA